MQEYGFSLTRFLSDLPDLPFCPYMEEYGSVKTCILAYFMQWQETPLYFKLKFLVETLLAMHFITVTACPSFT